MRVKQLLLVALLPLFMGLASCSNERHNQPNVEGDRDTFVGVSIRMPLSNGNTLNSTRTLPNDYNHKGEWQGRDVIESVTVYVVTTNGTDVTVNKDSFTKDSFNGIDSKGWLTPTLAVKAKSGDKVKVYAVINDTNNKVTTELNKLAPAEFNTKFGTVVAKVGSTAEVASYDVSKNTERVVMTNTVAPAEVALVDGVSKDDAIAGKANHVKVNVQRVAARAILTVDQNMKMTIDVKRKTLVYGDLAQPNLITEEKDVVTATVTVGEVQYKVSGSALQFNVLEDAENWIVPRLVYDYMPSNTFTWITPNPDATNIFTYDEDTYQNALVKPDNQLSSVIAALNEEKFSKFVLPVTHADDKYRKGNTTMYELKVPFTVDKLDGQPYSGAAKTVYLGLNDGLFYSTKERAESKDATHVAGTNYTKLQEAKEYKDGFMYYYLWLNPDVDYNDQMKVITKSPTTRNQVYHAHIKGFGDIGLTGKEIVPPEVLEEKPLYVTCSIRVLNWGVHSYSIDEVTNRY